MQGKGKRKKSLPAVSHSTTSQVVFKLLPLTTVVANHRREVVKFDSFSLGAPPKGRAKKKLVNRLIRVVFFHGNL